MHWMAERGITLIEATIVLMVVSILTGAAAPTVSRTLARGRLARAMSDTAAIRTAVSTMIIEHTLCMPFVANGACAAPDTVEMLVSDGDIPPWGLGGGTTWDDPIAIIQGAGQEPDTDFLEKHLALNLPGGGGAYSVLAGGWRGAYINSPIDPDPWGNRYAVNVAHLRVTTVNDVFVISAGPDEDIDTATPLNGARPGADDIINIIRRDLCVPGCMVP